MAIEIVRATRENAVRLSQIAHSAKSFWGYPSRWIELWRDQLTISGAYIETHEVYAATDEDGVILGFYALAGDRDRLTLDHMWVQPSFLWRRSRAHPLCPCRRPGARRWARRRWRSRATRTPKGFYQRMGAETIGEVTYELEGQPRRLPLLVVTLTPDDLQPQHGGE